MIFSKKSSKKEVNFDFAEHYFELAKIHFQLSSEFKETDAYEDFLQLMEKIWDKMSMLEQIRWDLKWHNYLKDLKK